MTTKSGEEVTAWPPLSSPLRVATRPLSFFFFFNFFFFFLRFYICLGFSKIICKCTLYDTFLKCEPPPKYTSKKQSPHLCHIKILFFKLKTQNTPQNQGKCSEKEIKQVK
jgi:hypothetical protein